MKVLLTGEPHSGKTTLLSRFLETIHRKQGFIAKEVLKNGERTGFQLESSLGQTATLASVESQSPVRVSRYGVEIDEIDRFLTQLPPIDPNNLLYIDEIGRMEVYSKQFKDLVTRYLDSGNLFIGTITSNYSDDFINNVKSRPDVEVIEVTKNNRDELLGQLSILLSEN